jgi:tyrosinase
MPRRMPRRLSLLAAALLLAAPAALRAQPEPQPPTEGIRVEIEINRTPETADDYVTWAPTFCQARLAGGGPAEARVVLTNDSAAVIPDGGDVLFAPFQSPWPAATTATLSSLPLTLPADGSWVPFAIAGKFGKPSVNDKDAVIEARLAGADGAPTEAVLGRAALMVRVRKNANNLTAAERDRFLNALRTLHFVDGRYAVYQEIHAIASDEAHGGPAFPAWHRAAVLRLERALQAIDPSVAMPYWKFDAPAPNLFRDDFMGANQGGGGPWAQVVFAPTNPLNGWTITGLTPIRRGANSNHLGASGVQFEADTLAPETYADFLEYEGDPHGSAHVWVGQGGWMGSVPTAVRDPVFFLLHCNVDRLWAKWQWLHDRFGDTEDAYVPAGTFPGVPDEDVAHKGHYRGDTMWPWNGETGRDPGGDRNGNRPVTAPGGSFPAVALFHLGPPERPTPGDMVDYLGRSDPEKGLGFCYDDTPYSP